MLSYAPPTLNPGTAKVFELFFTPQRIEVSNSEAAFLKTAASIRIPYGEIELSTSSWGDGPVVMLVHGWGGNRAQLRGFVPPLVEAGYRVVAFDFPAHGDTPGQTTNILEMSPAFKAVQEHVGQCHAIIAHSFGTLVTSYTLVNHPEIAPNRLVYFGAMNRLMDSIPRFQKQASLSDESTANLKRKIEETFGRELLASIANESLTSQLMIPTLMFHDEQDPITPIEDSREIASSWPFAKLVTTNGLGHRRPLKDEKIIRRTVEFICE